MTYITILSQIRQISRYRMRLTCLALQDYDIINLDQVTVSNIENLFFIKRMESCPYEMPDNVYVWASAFFDLSLDLMSYE